MANVSLVDSTAVSREDSNRASQDDHSMPPELISSILDHVSATELVHMRAVSYCFADLIDSVLQCRMSRIVHNENYELLFESCPPSETRTPAREALSLSHFDKTGVSSQLATLTVASGSHAPQFVAMDDDEAFTTLLLTLRINVAQKTRRAPSTTPTGAPADFYYSPSQGVPSALVPLTSSTPLAPIQAPNPNQSRPSTFSFSLGLSSSLIRVFRTWFEQPIPVPAITSSNGRAIAQITIKPTPANLLASATLSVFLARPSPPPALRPLYPTTMAATRLFEFNYTELKVHVAKFCVAAEQGLDQGGEREKVVLWMRM